MFWSLDKQNPILLPMDCFKILNFAILSEKYRNPLVAERE